MLEFNVVVNWLQVKFLRLLLGFLGYSWRFLRLRFKVTGVKVNILEWDKSRVTVVKVIEWNTGFQVTKPRVGLGLLG